MNRKSDISSHVPASGVFEFDVFLSHNSADKPVVEILARRLHANGVKVWLDKWSLIPGEPWQEALEEGLDRSRTVVIAIGPAGIGPWQNEEMRSALDIRVRDVATVSSLCYCQAPTCAVIPSRAFSAD